MVVKATGMHATNVMVDRELQIRKTKVRIKQLELSIDQAEIRLLDMDNERDRIQKAIGSSKSQIADVEKELKELEDEKDD